MDMSIDSYVGGLTSLYDSTNNQTAAQLQNKISGTDYSGASDEELMEVCKEFEAYFLEQVFKGMEKMIPESDSEDSTASKRVDFFKDTMIQQIASDSTQTQGLGLAQTLYESMKREYQI